MYIGRDSCTASNCDVRWYATSTSFYFANSNDTTGTINVSFEKLNAPYYDIKNLSSLTILAQAQPSYTFTNIPKNQMFQISDFTPPILQQILPLNGSTHLQTSNVTLFINATDADPYLRVEYMGYNYTGPVSLENLSEGEHIIYISATDTARNQNDTPPSTTCLCPDTSPSLITLSLTLAHPLITSRGGLASKIMLSERERYQGMSTW